MTREQPAAGVEGRSEQIAAGSNLAWVTAPMIAERDHVLNRWLTAARSQPFHAHARDSAIADHIPALYDAIVAFLDRGAASRAATGAVLDDPVILAAAQQHAQARLAQGLEPVGVTVEFRLLRQEIVKTLRDQLPDTVPTSDVLGGGTARARRDRRSRRRGAAAEGTTTRNGDRRACSGRSAARGADAPGIVGH